jgi:hypothetical protein
VLRRLDDEPLAVPDRVIEHLDGCVRCGARRVEIAHASERAAQLLCAPRLVPDIDDAWARIQRELGRAPAADAGARRPAVVGARRPWLPRVSLRAGLAIGAVGVVVVGTAAAASLTTIFAPTHVAPVSLSQSDLRAIASLTGLGDGRPLGGFATPSGSSTLRFGTISWSSTPARPAASLAQATAQAGFAVALPAHLPEGVGAVQQFIVQPRVSAVVTFDSTAAALAGSSVTIDAGPGVVAEYSTAGGPGVPTLAVMTMRRPTARSAGASLSQLEAFLLSQPGVPPALGEEVRLLGDPSTTLPVPVPAGASVRSVGIDGRPGVLVAAANAAAGVVWEDARGLLHAVVGILDSQDVLGVARQVN